MLLFLLFLGSPASAQPPQAMIEPHAQAMPLLPFLDYMIDESMGMDIEEVARLRQGWQPLALDRLPREEGVVWLRFTIAPLAQDARARTFLLDMGQSVPGEPILYDQVHNELSGASEWRENLPAQRNILLLPEAGSEALACYIRIDGLPGPWFAPMIRTPQNAASNLSSLAHTGGILALAVIMLLCALRALGENGQWRYWTALFVGMALCQALLGMPTASDRFSITDLAAAMSPGLALMFLPHVGRHLMQAKKWSRSIDVQLFLLSLPGAALALLPLAPGWGWLDRWLDLWPAGTILFVPTALGAWLCGIPGSRRFLLACVLPPLFVAFSVLGLEFGLPANLLAAGPIWSVAICALLLAAMRAPQQAEGGEPRAGKEKAPAKKKKNPGMPALELDDEPVINLELPLDDPNLRLIPPQPREQPLEVAPEQPLAENLPLNHAAVALEAGEARERALWQPVDEILRAAVALGQCSLPPNAKEAVADIKESARKLGLVLSGQETGVSADAAKTEIFNLQRVLRSAHDSVAAIAECSGVALSWYMPPHLPQMYRGDGEALEKTLRLLLESAVRCCRQGAIKLSARSLPGSADSGSLLFTVSDDGHGYPPHDRSSLALARAWELTGRHEGYMSVEASGAGAQIAFTVRFTPADEEFEQESGEPVAILAATDPGEGRQLARIMEAVPCHVTETANSADALAAQRHTPSALLVTQGRLARPSSGDMVKEFCKIARQSGIGQCHVLAITTLDESQWPLLKASGFTHAMREPVDPEILKQTVADLLGVEKENSPVEPFSPEASALADRPDDRAPTMLIDQGFSMKTAFEGPDWLAGEHDGEAHGRTGQAKMPPEPDLAELPRKDDKTPETAVGPNAANAENGVETGGEPVEWVGEPTPIIRDKPSRQAEPQEAVEWVGEPRPLEKPITDYIVGVEAASGKSAVKDFMEGSASLVSSALSHILTKKEPGATQKNDAPAAGTTVANAPAREAVAPVASTEQTHTLPQAGAGGSGVQTDMQAAEAPRQVARPVGADPEVLDLLDRLDSHMRAAESSYKAGDSAGVADAVTEIAADTEQFGLRTLTRMALCVHRAAAKNDMDMLKDFLPELKYALERTRVEIGQKRQAPRQPVED